MNTPRDGTPRDSGPLDTTPRDNAAHDTHNWTRDMHSNDATPQVHEDPHDARFDAAMRGLHVDALGAVSPRVAAQLTQRRRAALAGNAAGRSRARRFGWPIGAAVAASFAALLAVSIGLQSPSTGPAPSGATTVASASSAADAVPSATGVDADGDGIADGGILDENPDFYAWLASSDATALAME